MNMALGSLILIAALGQAPSQPEFPQTDAAQASQASLARLVADMAEFELSLGVERPEKLKLAGEPVLRWNYPIRNVDDGAVFVWLSEDRPEAIATVMSYRDARNKPRRAFEFLSLSQDGLRAVREGARLWQPERPGVEWRPVPEAPEPADTAARRRRQMHDLAAKFQVSVESDKNRYELRLLSQPLYRYQNAKAEILDGALFALAEGTDPELILALESSADKPGWKFSVGRLTRWAVTVRFQDKVVRELEPLAGAIKRSDAYHIWDGGPLEPEKPSRAP